MNTLIKKQQGSFFAEVGAVIASISILTLISASYMDSMQGRAQVTEAFVLSQPIIQNVNDFYASHGQLLYTGTSSTNGNYPVITLYDNSTAGNVPNGFAGRYVQSVESYKNGVVKAVMNVWHNDADGTDHKVGQVSNVQTAIAGEEIFFIPFLIGESTTTENPSENTNLRWACATTIDAHPPTGSVLAPLAADNMSEQYFYAPGCIVISSLQADCLNPDPKDGSGSDDTCAGTDHAAPINWNSGIPGLFDITMT
jgi:hypothetical protein